MSVAKGEPDPPVRELIDVGEARPVALVVGIGTEVVVRIHLAADVQHDRPPAEVERTDGPQVDRAGEALTDELRVRRLVDDDLVDQFGRVLVEFDAAIVAGADLLAAIHQRIGKARIRAAQADRGRTTLGTLRGQAREPRDGLGDTGVRQLADVLGGNRLDDAARVALGRDRAFNTGADAGDDDLPECRRLLLSPGGGGCRQCRGDGDGQCPAAGRGDAIVWRCHLNSGESLMAAPGHCTSLW